MSSGLMKSMCVAAMGLLLASVASAASVSTGVADWNVVSGPVTASPAFELTPNAAWDTSLLASGAKWIGANGTGVVPDGDYVYRLELALAPGDYELAAQYSTDNAVTKINFSGNVLFAAAADPNNVNLPNSVWAFTRTFSVSGNATSPQYLEITVFNGVPGSQYPDNPSGLIVSGAVTAVPVPAAAWAGMSLLGALAVARKMRRNV